ncbi:hypothetical protein ACP4OV_001430 [Aristida adscensionis]
MLQPRQKSSKALGLAFARTEARTVRTRSRFLRIRQQASPAGGVVVHAREARDIASCASGQQASRSSSHTWDWGEVDDAVLIDGHCVLSDEPSAPGCVVLLVEASVYTFIWYCRPVAGAGAGGDRWAKHEYDIGSHLLRYPDEEDQYEKDVICTIAACGGTIYFNSRATELRVVDFTGGPDPEPALSAIAV